MKGNDILYKEVSQDKLGGLNAFQIKIIACFCMTIDHIGAFGNQYYAIDVSMVVKTNTKNGDHYAHEQG